MNRQEILEESDSEDVADALGIPMKKGSGRTYILCPGHERRLGRSDASFGNCVLTPHGYHCFACGASVGLRGMVQEVLECSDDDAYKFLADVLGTEYSEEKNSSESNLPKLKLSADEARIIGLSHDNTKTISDVSGTVHVKSGLFELYRADEKSYYRLIIASASDMKEKYQKCMDEFCYVQSPNASDVYDLLGDKFDNSVYKKLQREIKNRIEVCDNMINLAQKLL